MTKSVRTLLGVPSRNRWGGRERHTTNTTYMGLLWLLSDGEFIFFVVVGHEYWR